MPNQRKKGKQLVGTWFKADELSVLRELQRRLGTSSRSQTIKECVLREYLRNESKES